jgi:subtilisin family serine protease
MSAFKYYFAFLFVILSTAFFPTLAYSADYENGEVLVKVKDKNELLQVFSGESVKGLSTDKSTNKILSTNEPLGFTQIPSLADIKFTKVETLVPIDPALELDQFTLQTESDSNLQSVGKSEGLKTSSIESVLVLEYEGEYDAVAVAKKLQELDQIEVAEPNYIETLNAVSEPTDPLYPYLWYLNNTGQFDGTPGEDINILKAWEIANSAPNTKICYNDRVPYPFADFEVVPAPRYGSYERDYSLSEYVFNKNELELLPGPTSRNDIDDDKDGWVDNAWGIDFSRDLNTDQNYTGVIYPGGTTSGSHGGEGIALIAAVWDNDLAMSGLLKEANIEAVGVCGLQGCKHEDSLRGYKYAIDKGCKIINASYGGTYRSEIIEDAIKDLQTAGVLLVAAAGNSSLNNDETRHYPASYDYDNVIAVGSINNKGQLSDFSNYGLSTIDIAAPGEALPVQYGYLEGSFISGTSFAAPLVTGVAALVWDQNPSFSYKEVKQALYSGAKTNSKLSGKIAGSRSLDAYGALMAAGGVTFEPSPTPTAVVDIYDVNLDGSKDTNDISALIAALFNNDTRVYKYDINGDTFFNMADVVTLIKHLFN